MTGKGRLWPGSDDPCPGLIQGGMGVGASGWQLARAVAAAGQLGVVSGVALDAVLARRLQRGDPGGGEAGRLRPARWGSCLAWPSTLSWPAGCSEETPAATSAGRWPTCHTP